MLVHHKLKLFYGSVFDASVVTTYVTAAVDHRLGEKVLPVVSSCFDGRERTMLVVVGCASQVSTPPAAFLMLALEDLLWNSRHHSYARVVTGVARNST